MSFYAVLAVTAVLLSTLRTWIAWQSLCLVRKEVGKNGHLTGQRSEIE